MKKAITIILMSGLIALSGNLVYPETTPEGTAWVEAYGYINCIELSNGKTTVILEPNCGGRVIEYSQNGSNMMWIDPEQNGWTYTPGKRTVGICAGRFDIGPEKTSKSRRNIWFGKWDAEITGPRSARLSSVEDPVSGVQLIRDFKLDKNSSFLSCTQTIKNISDTTQHYCHWSRTFAKGGGICVVPISPGSRFPKGYIFYEPVSSPKYMNFRPEENASTRVRDGFLEIIDTPPFPKFGLDSSTGWMAYITPDNQLFVKKFEVSTDRPYSEMASITISIWYVDDKCELEPIGPGETLKPGESASFTEEWWLFPYDYPRADKTVDLKELEGFVRDNTK